ncbi:Transducin beta-like protein 2 [Blattella germanica]|nr:Transducin beta-like protein 2 [Blattella germanica]
MLTGPTLTKVGGHGSFAPDVKVWEVKFSKTGEFQQVARAYELTGHSSGVYDVGFSADSSRMVSVSKDGTWRAYNTKRKYNHVGPAHVVMSPNGEVVVVSSGSSLAFYSVQTGDCDGVINNIFSCDKHVRIFHNVTGYKATIASTRAKLRQSLSSAQKERMEQQVREAETFLETITKTR